MSGCSAGGDEHADPIAVAVDASGRWLYVSLTSARSVVTCDTDRNSGALALKQITSTAWQIRFVHSPLTLSSYIQ